jgi:hypothetical protein
MKTFLLTSAVALIVVALSGTAYAQGYCGDDTYLASDGRCYPNQQQQYQAPIYQSPAYVVPPVIEFGFGGHERHEFHGGEHHGGEHHDHH